MNGLDSTDFWQMIGLVSVLVIGFLPAIKPIKGIDKYSVLLVMLFIIALITTVYTTLEKSISAKEDYSNLVDSTNSALKKVNQNVIASNKIMVLTNESIIRLQDLQDKNLQLHNEAISINYKSSEIQKSSNSLNNKLRQEIEMQKQTNNKATNIIKMVEQEKAQEERLNRAALFLSYSQLRNKKFIIYDALQNDFNLSGRLSKIEKVRESVMNSNENISHSLDSVRKILNDFAEKYKYIKDSVRKSHNKDTFSYPDNKIFQQFFDLPQESDKFYEQLSQRIQQNDRIIKDISNEDAKLSDNLNNSISLKIINSNRIVSYIIKDSLIFIMGIKEYLNQCLNLLLNQFSNPYLQENRDLLSTWLKFYNSIHFKYELFYVDNLTFKDIKQVEELINEHEKFIEQLSKSPQLRGFALEKELK